MNRTLTVVADPMICKGPAILVKIALEDTEERETLKAAGYRWLTDKKAWTLPVSGTALKALLARNYSVDLSSHDNRMVIGTALARRGFDLAALPMGKWVTDHDAESGRRFSPFDDTARAVFIRQTTEEWAARMARGITPVED